MAVTVPITNPTAIPPTAVARNPAINAGMGLGFMPCAYGDANPALKRIRPIQPGFGIDVWLLTHPDLRSTARVRAFMQHSSAWFESNRSRFDGSAQGTTS